MAVLSLAIGIGANAAIFGVAHAVLFRQSPLADPETLVNIYEAEDGKGFNPMSHPNIEDLRRGTTARLQRDRGVGVRRRADRSRRHGRPPSWARP